MPPTGFASMYCYSTCSKRLSTYTSQRTSGNICRIQLSYAKSSVLRATKKLIQGSLAAFNDLALTFVWIFCLAFSMFWIYSISKLLHLNFWNGRHNLYNGQFNIFKRAHFFSVSIYLSDSYFTKT